MGIPFSQIKFEILLYFSDMKNHSHPLSHLPQIVGFIQPVELSVNKKWLIKPTLLVLLGLSDACDTTDGSTLLSYQIWFDILGSVLISHYPPH